MSDEYDPLAEDGFDEVEDQIEEVDEGAEGPEGDRDADEDPQETAGAAHERGQAPAQERGREPSRAQRRVETALREAREAKEEIARLRAEAQQRPTQPAETAAQRAERLAMMDPDQRVDYLLNEQRQQFGNELAQIRFQTADSADRTAFDGLCARNPVASKLRDNVESYLADMRRNGTNAPRETVLKYVIGDRALANAGRATGKARRTAEDNRSRQAARPSSPRNDTRGESSRSGSEREARAKRLEDQLI
jgi:hypothetical protein